MAGLLVETTCCGQDCKSEKPFLTERHTSNPVVADISDAPFTLLLFVLVTVLTLISPAPSPDVTDYQKKKSKDKINKTNDGIDSNELNHKGFFLAQPYHTH